LKVIIVYIYVIIGVIMLSKSDIEYIIYLFNVNQECSVVLISQHMNIYDMKITKRASSYGIEFQVTGGIPYIINDNSLENELDKVKHDYYSYRILSTHNDPYYGSTPAYCSHEWVNVGFHWDKWVCKKCNKDKE